MENPNAGWAEWWQRHSPALLLFARSWSKTLSDAEDALQSGFVNFYRNKERAADPLAYLYTCVKRAALDLQRGDRRRQQREQQAAARDAWFHPVSGSDMPAEVGRGLAALPAEQRHVVVLKIWGGLTHPQIAEILAITANTSASRYRHALEKLRASLGVELEK